MMRSLCSGKTGLTGIAGMSLALICGIPFSSVASAQWAVDADGNWTDTANWDRRHRPGRKWLTPS